MFCVSVRHDSKTKTTNPMFIECLCKYRLSDGSNTLAKLKYINSMDMLEVFGVLAVG